MSDAGRVIVGDASATDTAAAAARTTAADVTVERHAVPERAEEERREEGGGDWSPVPPPGTVVGGDADDVPVANECTRLICEERKFDRNDDNDNPLGPRGEYLPIYLLTPMPTSHGRRDGVGQQGIAAVAGGIRASPLPPPPRKPNHRGPTYLSPKSQGGPQRGPDWTPS